MIRSYNSQDTDRVIRIWLEASILAHHFIPAMYWIGKQEDMRNVYLPGSDTYVFEDENYIEMYDFEHSIEEDRYIAIGCVGDVLFVVFTERKDNIRLISARLATESERRLYYDQNIHY